MGRWTQYDEDDYRLPEGMKRIGYDADSGRYYFRDSDGTLWKGAEGVEFGEMTRVNSLPASISVDDDDAEHRRSVDLEASPRTRNGGYQLLPDDHSRPMAQPLRVNVGSYRTLFPFYLIIAVILLLIWRLILSPGLSTPTKKCPEGTSSYWVQPGDNCWEVAREHGWTMDKFKEANPKVVCEPLMPGTSLCLPPSKNAPERRLRL
ncbi:carbohydrate-binding module family 50 protein [Hebeloma cylindrosporum]|uniref:Carbohydrate-binding module family 50 protein n=1 Tax=Hebeloma cylindrosporum TaxID=76867 RepID=A0A0C3BUA9_HEBCY|nr:carbohydrate-binding module family 50 protein [Hebeloma cylindrosporum h7]